MTKTLTPKPEDFLEALLGEARGHIRAALDLAGYSRTTKTAEVVGPLKEEITERAGMMLAMNAPKAAFGIVDVIDDPSAMGAMSSGKFLSICLGQQDRRLYPFSPHNPWNSYATAPVSPFTQASCPGSIE